MSVRAGARQMITVDGGWFQRLTVPRGSKAQGTGKHQMPVVQKEDDKVI